MAELQGNILMGPSSSNNQFSQNNELNSLEEPVLTTIVSFI